MTRARPLLSLSLTLALLAACSDKDQGKPAGRGTDRHTYVHAGISEASTLDPAIAYDTSSHYLLMNVYEPLLDFKGSSLTELEGRIAEKVPTRENGLISADGRTYTFPIRKGVRFHEGGKLTPEDVRYSLLRFMLLDANGGPSALILEPVTGAASTRDKDGKPRDEVFAKADAAVRVEGHNVVVTLDKPFAPFLTVLASWGLIVPKDWCVSHGAWDGAAATWKQYNAGLKTASYLHDHANGSGPFRLERWQKDRNEFALARFDDYWKGPARLARAVVKVVPEFQTRKLMLASGDADSIQADYLQLPLLQNLEGVQVRDDLPRIDMSPSIFFVMDIKTQDNPYVGSGKLDGQGIPPDFFADISVRKAFAHAMDYEGYIQDVNRGKGSRANSFIPKGMFGHDPAQKTRDYDLAKAEAAFRKAHGGKLWKKGFKFTFVYNTGNQAREVVANMIKRAVESINPKFIVETRPVPWSSLLDLSNASKLPMFIMGWTPDFPDPHNFAFHFMHSQGNYPRLQGYRNEEADKLVTAAMTELDPAKRLGFYRRLQEIAYEDVPTLFVLNSVLFRVQRSSVDGYVYNPVHPGSPELCPLYTLSKR